MDWNILDWSGDNFLQFYTIAAIAAFGLALILRSRVRAAGGPADAHGLSALDIAFLQGGPARACDTLVLELAARGEAVITAKGIDIRAPGQGGPSPIAAPGHYTRQQLVRDFVGSPTATAIEDGLVRRNLLLSRDRRYRVLWSLGTPVGLVMALGIAKLVVGLSRDRPVGYLSFLLFVTLLGLVCLLSAGGRLTTEGRAALKDLRADHDRLIRAPLAAELPLAFAFAGATALAGSTYAAYAKMIPAQGGSGGCGASGCGGGGGGCGGGGCGGCGS